MKIIIEVIKMNVKQFIHFRWGFLISLIADPIALLINIALFTSIYKNNNSEYILGYSLPQMVWYFAGITFVWYFIWNFADTKMSEKILSGDLAVDLLRPVPVFKLELANAISLRVAGIVFEFIPSLILYSLIFYPDFLTVISMAKFLIVVAMAFLLFFLINYIIGLLAFFIKNNFSLSSVKFTVIALAAGAYIPLDFFPQWLKGIINYLPFQYLFYWPIQFFLNRENTQGINPLLEILGMQLFWITVLYILSQILWKQSIRRFCSAGG